MWAGPIEARHRCRSAREDLVQPAVVDDDADVALERARPGEDGSDRDQLGSVGLRERRKARVGKAAERTEFLEPVRVPQVGGALHVVVRLGKEDAPIVQREEDARVAVVQRVEDLQVLHLGQVRDEGARSVEVVRDVGLVDVLDREARAQQAHVAQQVLEQHVERRGGKVGGLRDARSNRCLAARDRAVLVDEAAQQERAHAQAHEQDQQLGPKTDPGQPHRPHHSPDRGRVSTNRPWRRASRPQS